MAAKMERIVILGAGFAGCYTALHLEKYARHKEDIEILLIDKNNYWTFTPMLHEIVSGNIEPRHVIWPIRFICRNKKIRFEQRSVESIDFRKHRVVTSGLVINYDHLVIAMGSRSNFYGDLNISRNSFSFKTLRDAVRLRNHIINMFEQASLEKNESRRRELLTFVLAGCGCTGLELITEIHDFIFTTLLKYYSDLKACDIRIIVAEAGTRVLTSMPEKLAELAVKKLKKRNIDLRFDTCVSMDKKNRIFFNGKEFIPSQTLIWTAGIKANYPVEKLAVKKDKTGRMLVDEYLRIKKYANVYSIGDNTGFIDNDKFLPPTAQVAIQQAKCTAGNIIRQLKGREAVPFKFRYYGELVSLGARYGIVELFGFKFYGITAWLLWKTVYLFKLIGLKNKIRVLIDWNLGLIFERDTSKLEW